MRKMFIFVPAFGQMISATTYMTTHQLQPALASKGIAGSIGTLSFPDIAELRSMIATIWYDSMPDTEYLLFVDADMGFQPQLIFDMLMFGEPLVGAVYPQRRFPLSWAGSGNGQPTTERRGDFMRVEGVGMGVTLIRREVIQRIIEKFPETIDKRIDLHPAAGILRDGGCHRLLRVFEKCDLPDRGIVSEDLSFCLRWNRCGGEVWAAIGHKISHVGMHDFGACYAEEVLKTELAKQQAGAAPNLDIQNATVAVPDNLPLVAGPTLAPTLVQLGGDVGEAVGAHYPPAA